MALETMVSNYDKVTEKYVTTGPHTLYEGAVLEVVSRCERIMSDVYANVSYAVCWDAEKGALVDWCFADSEFGYRTGHISVVVDATPETLAAVAAYKAAQEEERKARELASKEAARVAALATPEKGKIVVVARGRKVAKGLVGEVIWVGFGNAFKSWLPAPRRAGVKPLDGGEVVWLDAKHLDVLAQNESEYHVAQAAAMAGKAAA